MAGFTEGLGLSGDAILYSFFQGISSNSVQPFCLQTSRLSYSFLPNFNFWQMTGQKCHLL